MNEKRMFKRVFPDPSAPVEIHIMGEGFLDVFRAVDISLGGAKIIVPHHFAGDDIHSRIQILVKLPDTHSFTASAVIKHKLINQKENDYYGLEFINFSLKQKETLEKYIQRRTQQGAVI